MSDIINIELIEEFAKDVYCLLDKDNVFTTFYSVNGILYLVYPTKYFSIILYDIINKNIIVEIKNAHKSYIIEFRHYLYKTKIKEKKDLILSISEDNNIKIWDVNNIECIFNIFPYTKGQINSSCFLYDNNKNELLIISSNFSENTSDLESIKIFNLKGEEIKKINDSKYITIFIDSFYDNKYQKNYIITTNKFSVISYDYEENKLYHNYTKEIFLYDCTSIIIYNKDRSKNEIIKIIYSTGNGFIKIFDFHLGIFLYEIKINKGYIFSICLLDEKYLFSCGKSFNREINKINDENLDMQIIHINGETKVKIINHPIYGKCILTKNLGGYNPIKLWKIKK